MTVRWIKRPSRLAFGVLLACACGPGTSDHDAGPELDGGNVLDAGPIDAGPIEPSLTVADQALALSTIVTIAEVASDGPGWIVVHEGDATGPIVGMTPLAHGRATNVQVALDRRASNETMHAVLHVDAGALGTFDEADLPVSSAGGAIVEGSFAVTVEPDTPAVRIWAVNVGDHAWTFSMTEPARYAVTPDPTAENPPLTLRRGWRYEVYNPSYVGHPFDLIDQGEFDVVKLSDRITGELEDDPDIAFDEVSEVIFRFTVTPRLEAEVNAYRCLIHPHMRGPVRYIDP